MRTIKLVVAYLGTNYHGFQIQPGYSTIQGVLEDFLSQVCGEPIQAAGSGRTDAGVHALGQVVSFRTNGIIPVQNIPRAAASMLPRDIAILSAQEMPEGFHARFQAISKEYHYHIYNNKGPNPFLQDRRWFIPGKLDLELMTRAAALLLGQHDFAAFCSAGSNTLTTIRTITKAEFLQQNQEITFAIAADGFLYHMVRNIIWALVELGQRRWSYEQFARCLTHPDEQIYIAPAPAEGLYLMKVNY